MIKTAVAMVAFALIPFVSMNSDEGKSINSDNLMKKEVKSNISDNDWTRIGVTEIAKKVGRNVPVTQKVQVYKNSEGTRAIKDNYGYQEIRENSMYNRFPADECFECGYSHQVLYNGDTWYTKNIVKQY